MSNFRFNEDLYRTKKCRFGERCNRRETCPSAHHADELRVAKCRFGNDCFKLNPQCLDRCDFWHPCDSVSEKEFLEIKKAEYFPVIVENRDNRQTTNTKMCTNMKENSPCVADACTFAHSFNDLTRRGMCLKSRRDCSYGDRCLYFHIGENKEDYVRFVQGIEAKAWMYRASHENFKPSLMSLAFAEPSDEIEVKKTDYVGRPFVDVVEPVEDVEEEKHNVEEPVIYGHFEQPEFDQPVEYGSYVPYVVPYEVYSEPEPSLSPEQVAVLVQISHFETMIASYRAMLLEKWQEAIEMNEIMDEIESYENENDLQDGARQSDLEDEFQSELIEQDEDYDEELAKFEATIKA